jgi:hypothetical protein
MTRKIIACSLAIIFITAITSALAIAHGNMPDVITIDKAQAKKPPVVFPHEKHSEDIACVKCHHTITKKEEADSCFECHGKDPDIPNPSVASAKENPFHILCKGCHKEQAKGPTKCAECHKAE